MEVDTRQREFVIDDGTATVTAVMPQAGVDAQPAGNNAHADGFPAQGACTRCVQTHQTLVMPKRRFFVLWVCAVVLFVKEFTWKTCCCCQRVHVEDPNVHVN